MILRILSLAVPLAVIGTFGVLSYHFGWRVWIAFMSIAAIPAFVLIAASIGSALERRLKKKGPRVVAATAKA
jgi:hypothetical protein